MRPWPFPALLRRLLPAGLLALGAGCDHLETGEQVGSLCDPGEEVFCRCANGQAGTRTCGDEGGGFDACTCSDEPGSGGGGVGGDGGSAGGGVLGELLAPCGGDANCASGVCRMGFCTLECAAASECPSSSSCVRFEGQQVCMPGCAENGDCAAFGAAVGCGWISAVDGSATTVCGHWSEASLPPAGTSCQEHVDCHLGHEGAEAVCAFGQCTEGCVQPSDCPAGTSCESGGAGIGSCS